MFLVQFLIPHLIHAFRSFFFSFFLSTSFFISFRIFYQIVKVHGDPFVAYFFRLLCHWIHKIALPGGLLPFLPISLHFSCLFPFSSFSLFLTFLPWRSPFFIFFFFASPLPYYFFFLLHCTTAKGIYYLKKKTHHRLLLLLLLPDASWNLELGGGFLSKERLIAGIDQAKMAVRAKSDGKRLRSFSFSIFCRVRRVWLASTHERGHWRRV